MKIVNNKINSLFLYIQVVKILDPRERDAFLMFRACCRLSERPILDTIVVDKNNSEIKS